MTLRVAYLTSRYPAVSHTFVQREVAALRELGVEVHTFSVRPGQALSQVDRAELATTVTLVPAGPRSALAAARLAIRHPGATARLLGEAVRGAPGGVRGRLWQVFYVVEALLLSTHLRRHAIDHVHAHFANVASDVAGLATRFARLSGNDRATWSFTMHGPTEFADVHRFRLADKAAAADLVVCISEFARSQLLALVPESRWHRFEVVHCGIDLDRFAPMDREPSDTLQVLCVGRLVPEKGQAILLAAIAELRRRGVDVHLTLVGDGPSRPALEREAVDVTFTGAIGQDEILERYRAADVFCLPSFAEGVPVVLMEAMATGLPVVTTRIAGIPELVEHGASGYVLPPGRADAVADALQELASDRDRRADMGAHGRAAVAADFEVHRSADQLRALLAATSSPSASSRRA